MASSSKILTVSYGTFSCTLEGFDEPFSTMKSIAEYFRDLASDDRYFGAEPPQPDAEMLHRIAEREIHKRVEARIEGDGVILRQTDDEQVPDRAPVTGFLETDKPAAVVEDVDAPVVEDADAPIAEDADAPVAEDADAPVAEDADAPVAGDADAAIVEDADEPVIEDADAPIAEPDVIVEPAEVMEQVEETALAEPAPAALPETDEEIAPEPRVEETEFPGDSIAAKLARIRQVVERRHAEIEGDDIEDHLSEDFYADAAPLTGVLDIEAEDETDDAVQAPEIQPESYDEEYEAEGLEAYEPAQPLAGDTEAFEADADAAVETDEAGEEDAGERVVLELEEDVADVLPADTTEAETEALQSDDDDTALAAVLGALSTEELQEEAVVPDEEPIEIAEETLAEDRDTDDFSDASARTGADDFADEDDFAEDDDFADEDDFAEEDDSAAEEDLAEEDEAEPAAAVRVTRVRRPLREVEDDTAADIAQEPIPQAEDMGEGDSILTPDQEAELMAELAEVEREAEAEDDVKAAARLVLEQTDPDQGDGAVNRLLAETNSKLESGEATRKRSAIAHLRAAVQAKRADDGIQSVDTVEAAEGFREDLARVVRPRRLGSSEAGSRRLAPLVLVSEQRIDAEEPAPVDTGMPVRPVRPRRVTKGNLALDTIDEQIEAVSESSPQPVAEPEPVVEMQPEAAEEATPAQDFAAFAQDVGATGMEELLEVAAVYECFVQGRPHFSRPQIMTKVLKYNPDGSFTREEGLRAFGKLLRDGTISKIKRGQFVISEDSRFLPGA